MNSEFTAPEPYDAPVIIELPEWQTIVARFDEITIDGVERYFDSGFSAVGATLGRDGLQPAGAAFAWYDREPTGPFSLEVGFPLAHAIDEPERIGAEVVIPSSLPAGRAAVVSHLGGYDGLGPAWQGLMAWAKAQRLDPAGGFWEIYVTEPSPDMDPATLRTDLVLPLAT